MDISTQKAKQYFALFYRYPQKVFQKCLMKPHEKSIYLCHTKIYIHQVSYKIYVVWKQFNTRAGMILKLWKNIIFHDSAFFVHA